MIVSAVFLAALSTTSVSSAGTLTVSSQTMDVGSVPKGAMRVPMLTLSMRASCDSDITLEEIALTHRGLGDSGDIDIYLAEGIRRVTSVVSFDEQSSQAHIRLRRFVIPKCTLRTFTVLGNIAPDADTSGEHSITLVSRNDIRSSARNIVIPAQTRGPNVIAAPRVEGTLSVTPLSIASPLYYGSRSTVGRFSLSADNRAHQYIRQITFTNEGSARDKDFQNLRVENRRGDVLTDTIASLDGKTVTLTFKTPLLVEGGEELIVLLTADIRGSITRNARFIVEEAADVVATPTRRIGR